MNASVNSHSNMSTMNLTASMRPVSSAELGGELGRAPIRRRDRMGDGRAQARGIEHGERRRGGTALRGHLLAQHRQRLMGLARHAGGTVGGRQGELVRDIAVPVSVGDSSPTQPVPPPAAMMDSASARPAAPTLGGAYKPVAPKPL